MKVTPLSINGLYVIEPEVYEDSRGFFFESFNERIFTDAISQSVTFVQDNHSKSSKGVLRGLHYQMPPFAQGKLLRVVQGKAFDVAVDLRENSPTFGQWSGIELSSENKKQLWIPEGFAHGFITLSDTAELLYKTTHYYHPESERCIAWDDKKIGIDWPFGGEIILSDKDKKGVAFEQADYFSFTDE